MNFSVKIAALATTTLILVLVLASAVYGATKTASDPVTVNATVDNFISISPNTPVNVNLGTIVGTGGSVGGTATWTVATNNDLGYKLEVNATGSPAMTKGVDSFADYSLTPQPWSILATDSAFGFSYDSGVNYRGFNGATPIQVRSTANKTAGEATSIMFRAEVGASHLQASGSYAANLTVTATTL